MAANRRNEMTIKEAEQNVLNQAKFWSEFLDFVDDLQYSIGRRESVLEAREKFAEGLASIRQAAYIEQQFAMSRCFAFVGVGGDEALAYSREYAAKLFGGYSTIQYLDKWNRVPSSWKSDEAEAFDAALKEAIKNPD